MPRGAAASIRALLNPKTAWGLQQPRFQLYRLHARRDELCARTGTARRPLSGDEAFGPAWWFNDSPEGMRRFREMTTETAGFYNTVGFNDDTRAFLSIPARHDVARRMDCNWLAQLVVEHRMEEWEAAELAVDLSYNLAKAAYCCETVSCPSWRAP